MSPIIHARARGASAPGLSPSPAAEAAAAGAPPRADGDAALAAKRAQRPEALDAAGRLTMLREAFEGRARPGPGAEPSRWAEQLLARVAKLKQPVLTHRSRLTKVAIGALLVAAVGWLPIRTLLQTTSTEALLNARLVTLRAPIEGEIGPSLGAIAAGTQLEPGSTLLRIVNKRADRGRLDDLRRLVQRLEGERVALIARRDDLEKLHAELQAQTLAFTEGRRSQLQARVLELESEIAAAMASREEADLALERALPLAASKTMTRAAFEKVRRDARVAAETHSALRHRLTAVEVELGALAKGVFVGDSYNDRPRSSQRADEIAQRSSEVVSDIRERETRIAGLNTEIAGETRRFEELAAAEISAPVRGSVWEVMTAPGETVVRGQELVRLLDCSGVVVTATVDEAAYNRLSIGDQATFRLRGEGTEHKGRIIGLTGVATAPANLAIQPAALAKEPYRVTVALPGLAKAGQCDIGRTGRVTFEK
jgi:multidrug resistance efflux pump